MTTTDYVLVTAAYNEEFYIERALSSVAAQVVRPRKWIVVSDGSTDNTDTIVRDYAERYPFIHLHRIEKEHERNFAAQVHAINAGFEQLRDLDYQYIGNLDADISLPLDYFCRLIAKFHASPDLGIAGGFLYEGEGKTFGPRKSNRTSSVPHGIQLFRRQCLECLGGYSALPYGGPDWHAEVCARMNGWHVQSFPDLPVFHHRPTGTAGSLLSYWYRQGLMDYSLGAHPLFEIGKLVRRLAERPPILGAAARFAGFTIAHCRGEKRPVSDAFIRYLRSEQTARLRRSFASPLTSLRNVG